MTLFGFGAGNATALAVAFFFVGSAPAALAADAEAGRAMAQKLCAQCHGPEGNSTDPAVPSLAGHPAQAIATQLFQFREGNRKDERMSPVAAGLSNGDMNNVAAFLASVKPVPAAHPTSAESARLGPELTNKFHCVQCHGPGLLGQQHIPRIAGQQAEYLRAQLTKFKAGKRSDLDGNMTAAAEPLTDKDIEVLVDYIAGLRVQ